MRISVLSWGVALGIAVTSSGAWAQIENSSCPLVNQVGDYYIITYDRGLLSPDDVRPLDSACSVDSPCDNATIIVDTPLWRDDEADVNEFRRDIQEMFLVTSDQAAFTTAPRIVFTNLADDPTHMRVEYEAAILQEAAAVEAVVQVDLPD